MTLPAPYITAGPAPSNSATTTGHKCEIIRPAKHTTPTLVSESSQFATLLMGHLNPSPLPFIHGPPFQWTSSPAYQNPMASTILVIVDRLSKMAHYMPCRDTTTFQDVAQLYVAHMWKRHGILDSIVSDRGTTFTSHFHRSLRHTLTIKVQLSTPFTRKPTARPSVSM